MTLIVKTFNKTISQKKVSMKAALYQTLNDGGLSVSQPFPGLQHNALSQGIKRAVACLFLSFPVQLLYAEEKYVESKPDAATKPAFNDQQTIELGNSAIATTNKHEDVTQLETVQVVGRRTSEAEVAIGKNKSHNTVAITHQALLSAPAGTSGLKMLESLAGFNVQTNDPLGLYEFGNSVSVRAFNFQQIGFMLDGGRTITDI